MRIDNQSIPSEDQHTALLSTVEWPTFLLIRTLYAPVHCTPHTLYAEYTVRPVHCTPRTLYAHVHCTSRTLYAVHCTPYTVRRTLYAPYTVRPVHCTPRTLYAPYTVRPVHCTPYTVRTTFWYTADTCQTRTEYTPQNWVNCALARSERIYSYMHLFRPFHVLRINHFEPSPLICTPCDVRRTRYIQIAVYTLRYVFDTV